MSSLSTVEKLQLERLLSMSNGYVLNFNNNSFAQVFKDNLGINIYDIRYTRVGDSKAKCMRAFWELESDAMVGKILSVMLEVWRYQNDGNTDEQSDKLLSQCLGIVARLTGSSIPEGDSEEIFLRRNFGAISLEGLHLDSNLIPLLDSRIREAEICNRKGASLATIFLCGSILEGLLLSVASSNLQLFLKAEGSPKIKQSQTVRPIQDWSLAHLIDVSHEVGFLRLDVKNFSHSIRNFRNYIHPYEQMTSGFQPDKHTSQICLQVLGAAVAGLREAQIPRSKF